MRMTDIPAPQPCSGEVQVKLAYAGVNPVDWKICTGRLRDRADHRFPLILGWDGAGRVSAVGEDVDNLKVGDKVFAFFRGLVIGEGTYCEYAVYRADRVVKKPSNLSLAEAAAIPLSSLTAWQALFDAGDLQPGESVLIHAGAGGVGGYAIQLARWRGAKIYTTASPGNHSYVKQLGADVVIDYRKEGWEEEIRAEGGVDLLFDTVGAGPSKLVKPDGRFVTIVSPDDVEAAEKSGMRARYVSVVSNGNQLERIRLLCEEGRLQVPHIVEMDLSEAATALEKSREGHVRGKIVLRISGESE